MEHLLYNCAQNEDSESERSGGERNVKMDDDGLLTAKSRLLPVVVCRQHETSIL